MISIVGHHKNSRRNLLKKARILIRLKTEIFFLRFSLPSTRKRRFSGIKNAGFLKLSSEWCFLKTLAYRFCHTSYNTCPVKHAIVFPSFSLLCVDGRGKRFSYATCEQGLWETYSTNDFLVTHDACWQNKNIFLTRQQDTLECWRHVIIQRKDDKLMAILIPFLKSIFYDEWTG